MKFLKVGLLVFCLCFVSCASSGDLEKGVLSFMPKDATMVMEMSSYDDVQNERLNEFLDVLGKTVLYDEVMVLDMEGEEKENVEKLGGVLRGKWHLAVGLNDRGLLDQMYGDAVGDTPGDFSLYAALQTEDDQWLRDLLLDYDEVGDGKWEVDELFIERFEGVYLMALRDADLNVMRNAGTNGDGYEFEMPAEDGWFIRAEADESFCVQMACVGGMDYLARFEDGRLIGNYTMSLPTTGEGMKIVSVVNGEGLIAYFEGEDLGVMLGEFMDGFISGFNYTASANAVAGEDVLTIDFDYVDELAGALGMKRSSVERLLEGNFAMKMADGSGYLPEIAVYLLLDDKERADGKILISQMDGLVKQLLLELDKELSLQGMPEGVVKKERLDDEDIYRVYLDFDFLPENLKAGAAAFLDEEGMKVELYYGLTKDGLLFVSFGNDFLERYGQNTIADLYDISEDAVRVNVVDGAGMASYARKVFALVDEQDVVSEEDRQLFEQVVGNLGEMMIFTEMRKDGMQVFFKYK